MADEDQRPPEGPDDPITLMRAAQLSGLGADTLRHVAQRGDLGADRPARDWFTSRRQLHRYLAGRTARPDRAAPLPTDYRTPEGEEPIA